jgi:hypothetical protein
MKNVAKTIAAGAVLGGSLAFTAGLGLASAQPAPAPDGLVNVAIGDAGVLEDVAVADAAQIAAGVCDIEVDQVTTMAETADAEGTEQAVCTNDLGAVLILQSGPGQSENAPGQQIAPGQQPQESPTSESPTAEPEEPSAEQGS